MKIYCKQCGKQMESEGSKPPKFCSGCGIELEMKDISLKPINADNNEEKIVTDAAIGSQSTSTVVSKKKTNIIIWIVISAMVLFGVFYLIGDSLDENTSNKSKNNLPSNFTVSVKDKNKDVTLGAVEEILASKYPYSDETVEDIYKNNCDDVLIGGNNIGCTYDYYDFDGEVIISYWINETKYQDVYAYVHYGEDIYSVSMVQQDVSLS